MGFLNPVLLALAAGVVVPLLLHFLHRAPGRRVSFPALRYLLRTERDHARRIRSRQLLLLALRMGAIGLAALAAARLVVFGRGAAHPPTAVAVVLDNSLSSGRVVGAGRVLDTLQARALAALELAGPGDRFWVIRAGEPWDLATPGDAVHARTRIRETRVSPARGELIPALERARALVTEAGLAAAEIHLLSDLQASAFQGTPPELAGLPLLVYTGVPDPGPNRYLRTVTVGGGLAPRANHRTEVAVAVGGGPDSLPVPVRVVVGGQLRGAAAAPPGGTAVLPVGPFPAGRLEGYAETDPDPLGADDRVYFSLTVEPPPGVAVVGDPGRFLAEAVSVLVEGGRIRRAAPADADVLLLEWGAGLESRAPGQRAVVIPGSDPALLPGLQRRLREAGIPLLLESAPGLTGTVAVDRTGVGLEGVRVYAPRRLSGDGTHAETGPSATTGNSAGGVAAAGSAGGSSGADPGAGVKV
ncbi:MAG: BatA domain-containing protein, partial [Longimicrobiales bacterium]|nr:BatA domain-containing protein [Longimicrobiales bacterium]